MTILARIKTMKNYLAKTILCSVLLLCMSCTQEPIKPFWDIPDPSFPEIAMVRADPHWGAVVVYNPDLCSEIGDACGFLKLHAFAHNHLNHTLLASPQSYPASQEEQADCWAAQYGDPKDVYAAAQLFLNKNRNPDWKLYGDLEKRAETLRTCAMKKGNWPGN